MVSVLLLIILSLGTALGQVQQPSTAGAGGSGGDGAINDGVSSSIKATVFDYTNSNPLGVVLRDTNGDYVSVGGGTQYTEGATQATPVGTVALGRDSSNILQSLLVDASRNLLVGVNLALPAGANTIGAVTQASGPWSVTQAGSTIVAGNSTTTPLGSGGNFTGTWYDATSAPSIIVSLIADQNSAASGVKFQWSSDGTNVDVEEEVDFTANNSRAYSLSPRSRYFRVNFTNGGVAQGIFRLQTFSRPTEVGFFTRALDRVIDDTFLAQLTRTVLAAKRNDGTYGNIRSTNGNNLKVSVSEFEGVSLPAGSNNIGDVDVLTLPSVTIGTFPDNEPFNLAQYNGSAVGSGNPVHITCVSGCTPGGSFSDNTAFTFGSTAINIAGYVFDDVTPNAVTENNAAAPRMSSNRVPYTMLRDAAGNERGANVTAGNALVVDGSAVTQPISAASLPLPTGAATETTLGTRLADATFTGRINTQGQKAMAGSTPVVIASDQSAVPVSGTVTANAGTGTFNIQSNASVNLAQIAGATTLTGNGVTGTGSPRVTIASDNTAFGVNLAQYTPSTGRLPVELNTNAGVNVAQMNGVAVTMGNGVSGTGVQRVAAASDNSAIANWGHGATGAAPPSGATQIGGVTSGATGGFLAAPTVCTEYANIVQTANTQVITGVSGRRIYICSINLVTATAQNVAVVAGTGTTCGTTTVAVPGTSGGTTAATGWNFAANGGIVLGAGFGAIAKTTVNGDNLCVLQSGAGQLSGGIAYAIY